MTGPSAFKVVGSNFRVRYAEMMEVLGRRVERVDSQDVLVAGSCYVFGADIELLWADQDVVLTYLCDSAARWYFIDAPNGASYRLRYLQRGKIAVAGGRLISGSSNPITNIVPVAASLPVAAWTYNATALVKYTPKSLEPRLSIPGDLLAAGSKSPTAALVQGFNLQAAVAPAQRIYVIMRLFPPVGLTGGIVDDQRISPLYASVQLTSPTDPVVIGDLASFVNGVQPYVFEFSCGNAASSFSLWSPAAEQGTGAAALKFWRVDWQVYAVPFERILPTLGPGGGLPGIQAGGLQGSPAGGITGVGPDTSIGIGVISAGIG